MEDNELYFAFNQKIFAERLEELRKKRGLTQGEFCKEIGVSTKQYQNWKYGIGVKDCPPSINKAIRICEICGISLDYLLGRSNYMGVDHAMIGKETGLSPLAVQRLTERMDPNLPPIFNIDLDKILVSPMYYEFMNSFMACVGAGLLISQNEGKIEELRNKIEALINRQAAPIGKKNTIVEKANKMLGLKLEIEEENKKQKETIYPALIHKSSRIYENMVDDICNMGAAHNSKEAKRQQF
ncbi:MAG: helix-turn-helix transcriptional regulator [Lachnospiraceae bacterium]|nr:helix-turn-helix transcriptional regulator [Lachnospiraceae bacterium]